MKKLLICCLLFVQLVHAQDDGGYKTPPKDIQDMLLAKPTPGVSIDDKGEWILFTQTSLYPSVEELAKPELKIAGLRINPANYSSSRQNYVNSIYLKNIKTGKEHQIAGLPNPLFGTSFSWSPSDKKIAFMQVNRDQVDLYVIDVATMKATRTNKTAVNAVMGGYSWLDDNTLLYRTTLKPASAAPPKPLMPGGPATQEVYGKASPRPTYQDMIKTPYDEQLFEFFATGQLVKTPAVQKPKLVSLPFTPA